MGKPCFLFILSLSVSSCIFGQAAAGWLPELTLSYKLNEKWGFTLQGESMQQLWDQAPRAEWTAAYRYVRTDLTAIASYRIAPLYKVAAGYLFRITDQGITHRSIQQLAWVQRLPHFRLGHRLRTDQTFSADQEAEFRLRYRLSAELPLGGQRVDTKEWYLVGSYEQLGKIRACRADWEQRLVGSVGYTIHAQHKVEIGLDYRLDRFIQQLPRHRLWGTVSYFININPSD